MVEIPTEELAIIFEPEYKNGVIELIPLDVVVGYYNEYDAKFVDDDLYTYSHATNCDMGRSYAYREKISKLMKDYPDYNLNEIRNILFENYSKFSYEKSFYEGEEIIIMTNLETDESFILLDEDTKSQLMCLINEDGEFIQEMSSRNEGYGEENSIEDRKTELNKNVHEENIKDDKTFTLNPHYLFKEITKVVKGQDEQIRKIVTTIWKNYAKKDEIARNMLILGYTGVGKTEIFRQLSKILDVPLLNISISGMSQAGYVGASTEDILVNLLNLTKGDVEKAEHAIVVLDEFNKIAYTGNGEGRIATASIQDELLKIIEDGTFAVNYNQNGVAIKKMINTGHITFVGLGAPDDILKTTERKSLGFGNDIQGKETNKTIVTAEDLKRYGIKEELVGRMGKIIVMNPMNLEMCTDIIKNSKKSLYISDVNFIKEIIPNVKIISEEEVIKAIAEKTLKMKVGARGISNVVEFMFEEVMNDISNPDEQYNELEFDEGIVNNPKKYILRK